MFCFAVHKTSTQMIVCYAGARLLAPYKFLAPSSTYGSIDLLKLCTHKKGVLFYRKKKKILFLAGSKNIVS